MKKVTASTTPSKTPRKTSLKKSPLRGILKKNTGLGENDQTLTDMGETFMLKRVVTASKEIPPVKQDPEPQLK